MSADLLLPSILIILILILLVTAYAVVFLINSVLEMRLEQHAMRRAIDNMDWTSVFSNLQTSSRESVRILDVLDKRLQKLEALRKLQVSQFQFAEQRQS
jgi:hypothetical protein